VLNLIPNFNPILALALFMPRLTNNKWIQYSLPVLFLSVYYYFNGGFADTLGVFASLLFATWCANKFNEIKSILYSCMGYFVFANISHGDLLSWATLEFNLSMFVSTIMYYILFKIIERIWQIAYQEV
jgi:hypothetical protein